MPVECEALCFEALAAFDLCNQVVARRMSVIQQTKGGHWGPSVDLAPWQKVEPAASERQSPDTSSACAMLARTLAPG